MLSEIAQKIRSATSVILSTHRHCDGDGLGAQLAVFHALRQMGKQVRILNVDPPSRKYGFLETDRWVQVYGVTQVTDAELALVFDTNDRRLVEPLFTELTRKVGEVLFVDHHPVLKEGPLPTPGSVIDTTAASTGEIAYRLINELGVTMTAEIARPLYVSVVFDTQLFRYVKSDPRSHLMAADLLKYERQPEDVHRRLFATYTIEKMDFLGRALSRVEYTANGKVAFVRLSAKDLRESGLDPDEAIDILDLVMNIETVQAGALVREDAPGLFKLSLRSKGHVRVLPLAEALGGGGHPFAAGCIVGRDGHELRELVVRELANLVQSVPRSTA
ncbi:MAG: bifunctional oligoribonuclease/PAP phosphatase NrnA [Bdellovibrionota bacterium]